MKYVIAISDSAPANTRVDLEWGLSLSNNPDQHMVELIESVLVDEEYEYEVDVAQSEEITDPETGETTVSYSGTVKESRTGIRQVEQETRRENVTEAPHEIDLHDAGISDDEIRQSEQLQELLNDGLIVRKLVDTDLVISKYLDPGMNVLNQDFSLLPLRKTSPTYDKGRKVSAEYLDDSGAVAVRKHFIDIDGLDSGLSALMIRFEWLTVGGDVGLEKVQIVKEYTKAEAETEMRMRRERKLDYLIAGAKDTPIGPAFQIIFDAYADEIETYRSSGSQDLATMVATEQRASLTPMLDQPIGMMPDGVTPYTIRHAILAQVSE